jgi:phage terminase Nu1 subunit (DNA packaging protein)
MKSKTLDAVMGRSQFSKLTGLSTGAISNKRDEGTIVCLKGTAAQGAEMRIDVARSIKKLLAARAVRGGPEFARVQAARAVKLELENARRRGELCLADDAISIMSGAARDLVGQLDGLPARLANELAGISDARLIRSRLTEECRAVRLAVSDSFGKAQLAKS